MHGIIKVIEKEDRQVISARELHEALGVGRQFVTWIKGRIEEYKFIEGEDFFPKRDNLDFPERGNQDGWGGDRKSVDYLVSVDMAKKLALVENNEKGREIRRHLIKIEKAWNTPEAIKQRATEMGLIKNTLPGSKRPMLPDFEKKFGKDIAMKQALNNKMDDFVMEQFGNECFEVTWNENDWVDIDDAYRIYCTYAEKPREKRDFAFTLADKITGISARWEQNKLRRCKFKTGLMVIS